MELAAVAFVKLGGILWDYKYSALIKQTPGASQSYHVKTQPKEGFLTKHQICQDLALRLPQPPEL